MKNNKMKFLYLVALFALFAGTTFATELDSLNRDPKYVETIKGRSQKIVDKLKLKKANVALDVRNIIANKYFLLNDIYEKRDAAVKKVKDSGVQVHKRTRLLLLLITKRMQLYTALISLLLRIFLCFLMKSKLKK